MSVRGELVKLEDGGHLAFDEYGDPEGEPVIFCHGWPSSRSMAELTDEAARELRVRIISPDRPGISGSSFKAERTLAEWPEVVRKLAAHLGLEKFRLLAISGGAPYAYAAAWALSDQVTAAAIVSGAPPIADLQDQSGLLRLYRWMLALHGHSPALLRALFHVARPFATIRPPTHLHPVLLKFLHPTDAAALRETAAFDACYESSRHAWRNSARGVIADAEIYARPWGFRLDEVQVPISLWHGTHDRAFSYRLAEELATQLPSCRLRIVEGAGHYSLPIRHLREILADLIAT